LLKAASGCKNPKTKKKIVALMAQVQSWEKVKAKEGSKKPDFKKGNNKKGKKRKGKGTVKNPNLKNLPGSQWRLVLDNLKTRMST
jgi:hypothetical protein